MADHQIPYGLQGDHSIHISELSKSSRGLKCGCVCPACGHPLVARMGDKNRHYFAHYRDSDCRRAAETGIHLRAKEIIQARKALFLPEKTATVIRWHQLNKVSASYLLVKPGTHVRFERVDIETPEKGFQPDVTGHVPGRKLFVEVRVTHAVDKDKLAKITASNTSCVEINLSDIDRFATPSQIETAIDDTQNSAWVYHSREQGVLNALHESLEPEYQRLVDKHKEALAQAKREKEQKDQFKTAFKEVGWWLSQHLFHHDIMPASAASNGTCHLIFKSYDDTSNAAFFDCHADKQNRREMVSIVWVYKNASRRLHTQARRVNIPYVIIDIAPLVAQHKPPHKPLQESAIEAFVSQAVIGALRSRRGWYIPPSWFREQDRQEVEMYRQQEKRRIEAERKAREAEAKEQRRQYILRLSQTLREDAEQMATLAHQCQARAEEIEEARARTDLSVIARWRVVSDSDGVAAPALEYLKPESLDSALRPLSFPYIHEWAYAEHPDFIKAHVVDRVIDKSTRQSQISIREIEAIYLNVVSGHKNHRNIYNLWGASSLAINVHDIMKKMSARVQEYAFLSLNEQSLQNHFSPLRDVFDSFQESDGVPISPNGRDTKRLFLSLLCQDMEEIGMLSPLPSEDHEAHEAQRYWLYNILE